MRERKNGRHLVCFMFASRQYKQYNFDLRLEGMLLDFNQSINQPIQFVHFMITCCSPQPLKPGIRCSTPSSPRTQPEPPYQDWS